MDVSLKNQLLEYLYEFITENKKSKIEQVSVNRTNHISVAFENIEDPKDISASLRSCECYGIQNIQIIQSESNYRINPDVAMGSFKWLDIKQYDNHDECFDFLRKNDYQIIAMAPSKEGISIEELDLSKKSVLFFGSEKDGLSEKITGQADKQVKIPMYGNTESYNISVSVALAVYIMSLRLRNSEIQWKLNEKELLDLKIRWVRKIIKKADAYEKIFLKNITASPQS
jgi:tRNA (guanosine-2'-O-)-methyltransferase